MLFTSISFLYVFLPLLLIIYYIVKPNYRNSVLLIFSLGFYAWGEPKYVFLMIGTVIINYVIGLLIAKEKFERKNDLDAKIYLIIGIVLNLGILFYFKYWNFFVENTNKLFDTSLPIKTIILPIGISFFIFQAMSYIIDVYREDGKVQKKIWDLMLYISLFPQLIAGPIVRYSTIEDQLRNRVENENLFADGINRFIVGLGKKILISNNMAVIADMAFDAVGNSEGISVTFAWIGALCYTLQIYFDFSGYSDMAIGLGKMFGFKFLENFNYPYISSSISEFWRRWHISLGSWFRDYVYIPLGGSRKGTVRTIINTSIVWFITGFWHGASWNFILWGCYFGLFIILEKFVFKNILDKISKVILIPVTFLLTVIGWVLFRSIDLTMAKEYYTIMFGLTDAPFMGENTYFFIYEYSLIFLIGAFFATPIMKFILDKIRSVKKLKVTYNIGEFVGLAFLLYICTAHLLASNFNPFIYFNF